MTTSKWILFIVFSICLIGSVCICPYIIRHSRFKKAKRIAEHLQALFWGISCGILGFFLYGIITAK